MYFDKLDKKAAIIYLKKRLNSKSQFDTLNINQKITGSIETNTNFISNNNNLESKRIIYSFSKLDDKSTVTVQQKECSESINAFSNRTSKNSRISRNSNMNKTNASKEISTHEVNEIVVNPSNSNNNNYFGINSSDKSKNFIEDYQPLVHQSSKDS